ncbi:Protein HemX [Nymphon striatum]|nr:Protein HemX [Nymphon striatum]
MPDFAQKSKVQLLETEINENIKENKTHLNAAMHELRSIQDSTQHIAETVYIQVEQLTKQQTPIKVQTPTINDWSLGEVHFLLQTAVQNFELKKDKSGAIAALKLADNLLLERGSIELLPVRKQISTDIATVNQFEIADISALSQKIDALMLNLKPVEEESDKTGEKFDKPLQEQMNKDAKENLYQLFSLRLETLRIMLLQGDDANYHKQITRIKTLLEKYYSETDAVAFTKQLDALSNVNLAPTVPDISSSLKLLEKLMVEVSSTKTTKPDKERQRNYQPKANEELTKGLVSFTEGHWAASEDTLLNNVDHSESPLLNYLAAARAAHMQGAYDRRDRYLKVASEQGEDAQIAVSFDENLIERYGLIEHPALGDAIKQAEKWLVNNERSPMLLLALARLHRKYQLWGKSKTYYNTSLNFAPSAAVYLELAGLLEELNEDDNAQTCYKTGLKYSIHKKGEILTLKQYMSQKQPRKAFKLITQSYLIVPGSEDNDTYSI